jgi:hypothetical protein
MFGPKRDEETNQVKKDEMGGGCSTNGEKRNGYRI